MIRLHNSSATFLRRITFNSNRGNVWYVFVVVIVMYMKYATIVVRLDAYMVEITIKNATDFVCLYKVCCVGSFRNASNTFGPGTREDFLNIAENNFQNTTALQS